MFELSVAFKYLRPRRRQLSVSIIALLSVLVISLVVWLVVVFLSVMRGVESRWVDTLVSLNAPIQLTPTEAYYDSYFYQIDGQSGESGFRFKTIREKALAADSDPYDPASDPELPFLFPHPDLDEGMRLKDPVKGAFAAVEGLGLEARDFEVGLANLRLQLPGHRLLNQISYVGAFDPHNGHLAKTLKANAPLSDGERGFGVLLPKGYQKQGVEIGAQGHYTYYTQTTSLQEQRIPVHVAGFYDPGLMPTGLKLTFSDPDLVSEIRTAVDQVEAKSANGIHVYVADLSKVEAVKQQILDKLEEAGIGRYWNIETYRELEFARPLVEQFESDRTLFSLIALIIIIVACSNVISMLILLVNDKRREIGVLRAMGASTASIAFIFATCGTVMGLVGSVIGVSAALLTLHFLGHLVSLLSALQGHEAFNAMFFGGDLPNQVSTEVLLFVAGATVAISLISGLIPALKAALMRPSAILRSE
ncbi:MAG: ABC transporter permease [Parachlamydiales bacterium]